MKDNEQSILQKLKRTIQRKPLTGDLRKLARQHISDKEYDMARKYVSYAVSLGPRLVDSELFSDIGDGYLQERQYKEAIESYTEAVKLRPRTSRPLKGLGISHQYLGQNEQAINYYFEYLYSVPDDADVLINASWVSLALNRLSEASALADKATSVAADDPYVREEAGRIFFNTGEPSRAIEETEKAQELGGETSERHWIAGLAAEQMGDDETALAYFGKSLALNKNYVSARMALASLLWKVGAKEEAADETEKVTEQVSSIEYPRERSTALWQLGWLLYQQGKYQESINASKTALDIDRTLMPVRFNLALALLRSGQQDEAAREYRYAMKQTTKDNISDLAIHGIGDLSEALAESKIPGGQEILNSLEERYLQFEKS